MNVTDYTFLLNKPEKITEKHTDDLGTVLNEFPYFQSARALRLKGLYTANSFKYNFALKVTAAHTTDRTVLFEFITSDTFTSIQKAYFERKALDLLDISVVDSEHIVGEVAIEEEAIAINTKEEQERESVVVDPIEKSILTSIKEADSRIILDTPKTTEEKLELGKPLDFSENEKHSFEEWLQLARVTPIERQEVIATPDEIEPEPTIDLLEEEKKKKAEIINKFIKTNPKISPVKSAPVSSVQIDTNKEDHSYLMTETLARVYLEQKKYTKAIQAYEILILKYPEKISFFADRISDIKILQQNNNNN
ncbi:tetratricopeptide repeat protein [Flavobacterium sp. TMP13]|uniref:tetratricopeptide repeat protein n=1 Tax=unclassified Flavobacterium TaxID=196869 RepID=UPI00076DBD9B|nr:tetratricopeptide repeat protein [Flavobacterium sp. TAB 87]KVV14321.1 hypothetical protein AP058_02213 [Flavobacterium sp. TAB 87]